MEYLNEEDRIVPISIEEHDKITDKYFNAPKLKFPKSAYSSICMPGIYLNQGIDGNGSVVNGDVVLSGSTIEGDLNLMEFNCSGSLMLDNMSINGRVAINGYVAKNVTLRNSFVGGDLCISGLTVEQYFDAHKCKSAERFCAEVYDLNSMKAGKIHIVGSTLYLILSKYPEITEVPLCKDADCLKNLYLTREENRG